MQRIVRSTAWVVVAALMAVLAFQSAALACPTCKESLAQNDPAHANVVRGYFWSILFMMSMPYLILSGLGIMFWWQIRKAKLQKLREAGVAVAQTTVRAPVEDREPVEV